MQRAVGAEPGHGQADAALPIGEQLAARGIHEVQPQVVARRARDLVEIAEQRARRPVEGQVVPAAADDVGRVRTEVLDQPPDGRRGALRRWLARRDLLTTSEQDQVRSLGRSQSQRPGDRLEHLERGAHIAALLEPRVPGRADARQVRDLLAAQARGAAAPTARKPDLIGFDTGTAPAQEVSQLRAASLAVPIGALACTVEPGCDVYYQDKPISCTWIGIVAQCAQ